MDIQEYRSQLDPERAKALDAVLQSQTHDSLSWIKELDTQLTRTNFLTNGAAAIAVLAFMGTGNAPQHMSWPLGLFTLGVIATGIEIRSLMLYVGALHEDARRRRRGFLDDKLRVAEIRVPSTIGRKSQLINHWAGLIAQSAFGVGVILSMILFIWCDA